MNNTPVVSASTPHGVVALEHPHLPRTLLVQTLIGPPVVREPKVLYRFLDISRNMVMFVPLLPFEHAHLPWLRLFKHPHLPGLPPLAHGPVLPLLLPRLLPLVPPLEHPHLPPIIIIIRFIESERVLIEYTGHNLQ